MSNNTKKLICLTGSVLSLKCGECAIILCNGAIKRTSTVVRILKARDGSTLFETRNALYCVTAPGPNAMCTAVPLAACA
jgi:hypothetical protein